MSIGKRRSRWIRRDGVERITWPWRHDDAQLVELGARASNHLRHENSGPVDRRRLVVRCRWSTVERLLAPTPEAAASSDEKPSHAPRRPVWTTADAMTLMEPYQVIGIHRGHLGQPPEDESGWWTGTHLIVWCDYHPPTPRVIARANELAAQRRTVADE